ncbi:NACHT domain-containing protein [Dictyobacter formicarum]|uniref:Nephrocystin 3-like N-terminal domain-containing protein n=1 Tax=Dictyobacter formicarum TaxID=2778368 RepID=A0ABQ3VPN7_9CHLR|nr:NACHT domain-containing protein [Dictyobacter formicarum]GHO88060.1 hypothetical protein KSZ_60660 [Dictyobacter formicarum]
MDYQYENLGPERFQHFCQALIAREHPHTQCFPVGQPDGGRDAIAYISNEKNSKSFIIFQIKFVRKPQAEADIHKWLVKIMEEEALKIEKYIPLGAAKYYLLTNIQGTAHPDSGSIDKLDQTFSNLIKIPFQCWWRDDLSRRLDEAWNLKWSYPELMTGLDMLRYIFENGLSEHKEQRLDAIKSFLQQQYDHDQEVRFKQIELHNKLLDLFIDVPASFSHGREERKYHAILRQIELRQQHAISSIEEVHRSSLAINDSELSLLNADSPRSVGAATLMLHQMIQEKIPQIVLEGAPGQGKSTITQYICQVHRMHLLQKTSDLASLPNAHKNSPVRIPFRVDLRDLATWLNKQDPFASDESVPENWQKSLESFLAFQVKTFSGGFDFTVSDLHSIAKLSALLLVLDGFDEVAEINKRQEIVDVVKTGVNRLRTSCISLQVLITSRPTAFANSPGFPESSYPHFELRSITPSLITEYANKWITARRLSSRDSFDVKKILKEKLNQPHLRELARNPMQLAILLSLIHARGSSLPDKRTALYDSYVELFFNRESDKSSVVRDYRDLLIDIHRYLAWLLHSEAEQGKDRGSISSDRLQQILNEYLIAEGHDSSLTEQLFTGMVERVVALVSRVQGTYEFEVQPLREYFAARFLYETAPYSPPGHERKGTKPDRFDAIARNFYWLNVARFYAGCFSKGELPSLVDSLENLIEADGYRNISHPRLLAAMLLSDWVFTQNQKSMRNVIKLIIDGLGLRSIMITSKRSYNPEDVLTLPKNCGRDELVEHCFDILKTLPAQDFANELISLIQANIETDNLTPKWIENTSNTQGDKRTQWFKYGLRLGILQRVAQADLGMLLSDDPNNIDRLDVLLKTRHWVFCQKSASRCSIIIQSIFDGYIESLPQMGESIISSFGTTIHPTLYRYIFVASERDSINMLSRQFSPHNSRKKLSERSELNNVLEKCNRTIEFFGKFDNINLKQWKTSLEPWIEITEHLRELWGEQWAIFHIACMANKVNAPKEEYQQFSDLLDHTKPLCLRAYYAKSKRRSSDWWKKQFTTATTANDKMFVCLLFLTWATSNIVAELATMIDNLLCSLNEHQWTVLADAIEGYFLFFNKPSFALNLETLNTDMSYRLKVAIGFRLDVSAAENLYIKHLTNYSGDDPTILEFCQDIILNLAKKDVSYWQQALIIIEKNYAKGFVFEHIIFERSLERENNPLPLNVAKKITDTPEKYPRNLVMIAEAKYRELVASNIIPVGQIAKQEFWLDQA